jgi:hypothetical protein
MGIVLDPSKVFSLHPNEEILEEYVLHRLPEILTAQVEEHLLHCHRCQDAVAETDEFVAALKVVANQPACELGSQLAHTMDEPPSQASPTE